MITQIKPQKIEHPDVLHILLFDFYYINERLVFTEKV